MKVSDNDLINFYLMGVELVLDDRPFPLWFEFAEEKLACLHGYNDGEMGCVKTNDKEILEQIKAIFN